MKFKFKLWLDEFARDILALGGVLFYFLFIGRALLVPEYGYVLQLVFAIVIYIFLLIFVRGGEGHVARALIAAIFSIIYYNDSRFTVFITLAYLLMLWAVFYLKRGWISIVKGIALGVISTVVGYWVWAWLF